MQRGTRRRPTSGRTRAAGQGTAARTRHATARATAARPAARRRRDDRFWGWLGPLLVAVVGGILRFWHLGRPHQLVFDETYYVKQGYSMLQYGVETPTCRTAQDARRRCSPAARPTSSATDGDLVVHPPVGKWMIAVGEQLFGVDSSFGWRFSVALRRHPVDPDDRPDRRGGCSGRRCSACVAALLLAVRGPPLRPQSAPGCSTSSSCSGRSPAFCVPAHRPRPGPGAARRAARWRGRRARPRRRARARGWACGRGAGSPAVCLGLCAGTKWSGAVLPRGFGLMTCCGTSAPGGPPASAGGRRRGRSRTGCTPRAVDRAASRRRLPRLVGGWFRSHRRPTTGSGRPPTPRATAAGCPTRCARCGTTTGDVPVPRQPALPPPVPDQPVAG